MVLQRSFKGFPRRILSCSKEVLRVFQGSLKGVSIDFKVGFKEVQWMFEERFKDASRMFQGSFKDVPRKIGGCSKRPSRVNQGSFMGI